jgi:hypothetical protein
MTRAPQRLRAAAALAALPLLAVALAGCGGGGGSSSDAEGTTTSGGPRAKVVAAGLAKPQGCYLTVFLSESHTGAQKQHVEVLLLSSPVISEVSYVTKELALKRLAKTQPKVAAGMHVNPFPDSFEVIPATRGAVFSIITGFAEGVDGVTNVKASAACPSS